MHDLFSVAAERVAYETGRALSQVRCELVGGAMVSQMRDRDQLTMFGDGCNNVPGMGALPVSTDEES